MMAVMMDDASNNLAELTVMGGVVHYCCCCYCRGSNWHDCKSDDNSSCGVAVRYL